MKKIFVIAGLVLFTAAACNSSTTVTPNPTPTPNPAPSDAPVPPPAQAPTPTPTGTPVTHTMDISGFAFGSPTLTVKVGDTVTWTNKDTAPHTVTGNNGGPDSGTLATGKSYSYTFGKAGTFPYYCNIHPTMLGKVIVVQ